MPANHTCVVILGPESSGSKLVAKTCAHVLGVHAFGSWNATGWSSGNGHRIYHRSLPHGRPSQFPDVDALVGDRGADHALRFVLTTRDRTLSELSRCERFLMDAAQARHDSDRAREIMASILRSDWPSLVWSYETFMFLGKDYLDLLYRFIGVESDFMPELVDANAARIAQRAE